MKWTKKNPNKEGWYWYRDAEHRKGVILNVEEITGCGCQLDADDEEGAELAEKYKNLREFKAELLDEGDQLIFAGGLAADKGVSWSDKPIPKPK